MKKLLFLLVMSLLATSFVFGQKTVHVRTYTRKDGTVVQAHDRAAPGTRSTSTSTRSTSTSTRSTSTRTESVPVYSTSIERDSKGRIKRSQSAKHDFKLLHPCPATGSTSGSCRGYVIDHIKPLACGGADSPSNMQWQTTAEGKAKDKVERKGCR